MKMLIRALGLAIIHRIGTKIHDSQSGVFLGRILIIPWGGKIHLIGLERSVRPVFLAQKRLTYWKQEIGFTLHPSPDFPRAGNDEKTPAGSLPA